MSRKDIDKKIQQAEDERNRIIDGVKTQKETAEKRKKELSSLLKNMDPAASFEEFKKVQTEAATNEAFLSHLESAERQLKEATEAARKEYAGIVEALQKDVDERHQKAGKAIMEPLKKIEAILQEVIKEDNETLDMQKRAIAAYAIPQEYRDNVGGKTTIRRPESIEIVKGAPTAGKMAVYGHYDLRRNSRIGTLLSVIIDIEKARKDGQPF
ncbi:MAG: hypothetical protein IKG46_10535 [Solobacterium sp.]|nr:hypothetical protein [Oscillospiraceae bacterium]MBR3358244.1 hypothetical protein [Solobacterium sp.]